MRGTRQCSFKHPCTELHHLLWSARARDGVETVSDQALRLGSCGILYIPRHQYGYWYLWSAKNRPWTQTFHFLDKCFTCSSRSQKCLLEGTGTAAVVKTRPEWHLLEGFEDCLLNWASLGNWIKQHKAFSSWLSWDMKECQAANPVELVRSRYTERLYTAEYNFCINRKCGLGI